MKYLKVFTDFAEDIGDLGDAERGRLFTAMLTYAETGEEPELRGNERFLWKTAKKNIDNQRETYAARCEANARIATNRYQKAPESTKKHETCQDKDKDKEYKETLPIGSAKKTGRAVFTPPTEEEVKAYCLERKNNVDAQRFVDFYASKGWKVGNQPMKDWRAAVRTWERDRDATTSISRARSRNTLLNYDEKGRSHASIEEINLDLSDFDDDPPKKQNDVLSAIAANMSTEF